LNGTWAADDKVGGGLPMAVHLNGQGILGWSADILASVE
jgi:hypothetical protein